MPEVLTCASCQRELQVPEDLLGQDVQRPTCGATFLANLAGSRAASTAGSSAGSRNHEAPSQSRALEKSRRRDPDEDDYDDYDRDRSRKSKVRRRRRTDYEPHRGGMLMAMGIISIFMMQLILGPITWVMANNDLAAMRAGRM